MSLYLCSCLEIQSPFWNAFGRRGDPVSIFLVGCPSSILLTLFLNASWCALWLCEQRTTSSCILCICCKALGIDIWGIILFLGIVDPGYKPRGPRSKQSTKKLFRHILADACASTHLLGLGPTSYWTIKPDLYFRGTSEKSSTTFPPSSA